MERVKGSVDIWLFIFCLLLISCTMSWLYAETDISLFVSAAPFTAGCLSFVFQSLILRRPVVELYSKNYPYRKLKAYGVISAFFLFEFILMWGLHTRKILMIGEDLMLMSIVFLGCLAYYQGFIRMKISLRFLFLAIGVPLMVASVALGLGSYFNILKFVVPHQNIGYMVFVNVLYWIVFHIFTQLVCEEPAFRGYLMQRLLAKGEIFAVAASSVVFALWYLPFILVSGGNLPYIALGLCGNFIMGMVFALLFIKGRNLLVAALAHGMIDGLRSSFFSADAPSGIRAYFEFLVPQGETKLMVLWFLSLFIGLILITLIPRKKFYARQSIS